MVIPSFLATNIYFLRISDIILSVYSSSSWLWAWLPFPPVLFLRALLISIPV